jgi:hypothetical protein
MAYIFGLRRFALAVLTCGAIVIGVLSVPITLGALTPAAAQISEDAQIALEEYGRWRRHPRFGEVWVPVDVPRDWRPYQYGRWVYTDEWGWYWVSDDVEADWGWVVYHYGRWAFDRGFGWFWVPGDEWAPAWVDWRYGEGGEDYVGWAPLPPDELIETYESQPVYWVFVPGRYMTAPRWRNYAVPLHRRMTILRSTRIVNRTLGVQGARLAVNPGISPAFVARVTRAPVTTYRVRPRVFAATQGVSGAVQIRREELRGARTARPSGPGRPGGAPSRLGAVSVERTNTVIQQGAAVVAPQPLGRNERGRLGSHPPRAAQGGAAPQPGQAPAIQQQAPAGTPPPARVGPAPTTTAPAIQQQPLAGTPPPVRSGPAPTITAPAIQQQPPATTTVPPPSQPPAVTAPVQRQERREERREVRPPTGAGTPPAVQQGAPPPPAIVRPIPPQASPPPAPPQVQQRQIQQPPQVQQRQIQQPPPAVVRPAPPAAPVVRPPPPPQPAVRAPAPPPPAARAPAPPPPAARAPAPQPQQKKPPLKPGEPVEPAK